MLHQKMNRILALLLTVAAVFSLAACGGETKQVTVDAEKLADALQQGVTFQDTMTAVNEQMVLKLYQLEEADVSALKVYRSTGATAEEIAVITGKDEAAAQRCRQALEARVEEMKSGFADYIPAEMTKLNHAYLETKGNTVILCVADDQEQVKKVIEDNVK